MIWKKRWKENVRRGWGEERKSWLGATTHTLLHIQGKAVKNIRHILNNNHHYPIIISSIMRREGWGFLLIVMLMLFASFTDGLSRICYWRTADWVTSTQGRWEILLPPIWAMDGYHIFIVQSRLLWSLHAWLNFILCIAFAWTAAAAIVPLPAFLFSSHSIRTICLNRAWILYEEIVINESR